MGVSFTTWSLKKYPFRGEPKILDSMPNSGLFFRRSVGCPLLVSKYVLLDTISVDIIVQMRRKQLSRYLLYLVFRGWCVFLRGFLLQYLIICFGMQPTPLRNVSPPQSRDKKFSFRTTVCCAGTSALNDRGRRQWWPFDVVLAGFA